MSNTFQRQQSTFPFDEADKKQTSRKSHMQCQYCLKSKVEGAELKVCAGCKVAKYCSRECQLAAWKKHKDTCKANQKAFQKLSAQGELDQGILLRSWTSKHRPVLGSAALIALDLAIDASRAKEYFLHIMLTPRESYDRTERAYIVDYISVLPLKSPDEDPEGVLPSRIVQGIRQSLQDPPTRCLCPGAMNHKTGKYCVVLMSKALGIPNVVVFAYCEGVLAATTPGSYWKEGLIAKLNEGVVS